MSLADSEELSEFLEELSVNISEMAATRLVEFKCENGIATPYRFGTGLPPNLGLGFRRPELFEDSDEEEPFDDGSDSYDEEEAMPSRQYFAPTYGLYDEPRAFDTEPESLHGVPALGAAAKLVNAFTAPFNPTNHVEVSDVFDKLMDRNHPDTPLPRGALLFAVSYRHYADGGTRRMTMREFQEVCNSLARVAADRRISLWIDSKRPRTVGRGDRSMLGWLRQGVLPYVSLPTFVLRSVAERGGRDSFWASTEHALSLRGQGQFIKAGGRTIYRICPNGYGDSLLAFAIDLLLGVHGDLARLPNEDKDSMVMWAVAHVANRVGMTDAGSEASIEEEANEAMQVTTDNLAVATVVVAAMVGGSAVGHTPWDGRSDPAWGTMERQLGIGSVLLDGRRRRGYGAFIPTAPFDSFGLFKDDRRLGYMMVNRVLVDRTKEQGYVVVAQIRFREGSFSRVAHILETRLIALTVVEYDNLEFVCDAEDLRWA